jgi:hypothetical protein
MEDAVGAARITWIPIGAIIVATLMACSGGKPESGDEDTAGNISLQELVAKADSGEYHVAYDAKGADGSQGPLEVAVKGDKTFVSVDFEPGQGTEGGVQSIFIDNGSTSYTCGDLFGVFGDTSDAGEVCYSAPSSEENDIPTLRDLFDPVGLAKGLASAGEADGDGTESIAGRDGRCFKVKSIDLSGRLCVEQGLGVPLLLEGSDPASFSWRATELKDEVDDSVFEPPYEVKDFPETSPTP